MKNIDQNTIKKILLDQNYITVEDLTNADEYALEHKSSAIDFLKKEGLVNDDIVNQAIGEHFDVPFLDFRESLVSKDQINLISESVARKYSAVVYEKREESIVIATSNPDEKNIKAINKIFKDIKVSVGYTPDHVIHEQFSQYKKSLETRFSKIIKKKVHIAPELLEEIFEDALTFKASDIHFEPQKEKVVIRFRIDGVLQEAGILPKEYYENILNRIKIKSGLRIDLHAMTQDGSLRYEGIEKAVDMRTSIAPTIEGEKVVLRVLAAYVQDLTLSDIGLSSSHQAILERAINKPFGMILVVGPTGSGKTTTLYVLLKLLNSVDTNITTIEDPVEYKIDGVNQIQVNTQTGLTFSSGLRSIVRQDPDTILVGEIRDNETAEIAVNAALTGHLLLSTFHANDAATAVPRLIDMGLEPFLLSSTLEVIIGQRLVRKICEKCRYSFKVEQDYFKTGAMKMFKSYFKDETTNLYKGKGCDSCGNTGYHGRTAIFEFIELSADIHELITTKPSSQDIWNLARKEGATSLFEDGILKVKNGVTTLEELSRVAEPPKEK